MKSEFLSEVLNVWFVDKNTKGIGVLLYNVYPFTVHVYMHISLIALRFDI